MTENVEQKIPSRRASREGNQRQSFAMTTEWMPTAFRSRHRAGRSLTIKVMQMVAF